MTRDPVRVAADYPIGRALALMETLSVRHLLVADGERLTGIVSNRDVRRLLEGMTQPADLALPVSRIMTEEPVTVAPDTPIKDAAHLLADKKIGCLPVVSEGTLVGLVTTTDILRYVESFA
jgi:CBS domain-containing protein